MEILRKCGQEIPFDQLTPIYPDERITLEPLERIVNEDDDLIAPIGKGQRV